MAFGGVPGSPPLGLAATAPLAAAPTSPTTAPGDFFFLIIGGMTDPAYLPLGSSKFQFDNASNWRLEIPSTVLQQATQNKAKPFGLSLFLAAAGTAALGQASRMDVKACLLPQAGAPDGGTPGWGWKTIGQLSPTLGLSSVCEVNWSVAGIPHAVVLMVTALPAQSPLACPQQTVLDDNAALVPSALGAAAPVAAAGGGGGGAFGGGGGGGGGGSRLGTHIATLPMNMISAFIGPGGSNINQLRAQFQNSKVNVDKNTGHVTTDSPNFAPMGTAVQGWIAQEAANPSQGGGTTPGGGGGGGGGSKPRSRNNGRRR